MNSIEQVLKTIFQSYKGILAADARPSSMDRRLQAYAIESGEESRSKYRKLLFSTPNLERTISGVILSEDTFTDHIMDDGIPTRDYLAGLGIAVGVKVDDGLQPYANDPILQCTKGLDGLQERCAVYKQQGADFLKWRSAIPAVGTTDAFIDTVMTDMAEYARCALDNELVPILEPEVLLDGDHSADNSAATFKKMLSVLIRELANKKCDPHQCILKTSFIINGLNKGEISAEKASKKTLLTFKESGLDRHTGFYGIVFLSGGLQSKTAIEYIQRIKAVAEQEGTPYTFSVPITFSYARALQEPVLTEWKGKEENILSAQVAFTQTLQLAVKKYKGLEEAPLGGDGREV